MTAVSRQPVVAIAATAPSPARRMRVVPFARGAIAIALLLAAWEYFARSGIFSQAITPPLETIVAALVAMIADGSIFRHTLATMLRVALAYERATSWHTKHPKLDKLPTPNSSL